MEDAERPRALELTAKIVGSYVRSSPVPARDLGQLIDDVHAALGRLDPVAEVVEAGPTPSVAIEDSIANTHLTCLECGAELKTLKRHLEVAHGLSPDAYRARFSLDADYPMTAPGYAEFRSGVAKRIGLGGNVTRK